MKWSNIETLIMPWKYLKKSPDHWRSSCSIWLKKLKEKISVCASFTCKAHLNTEKNMINLIPQQSLIFVSRHWQKKHSPYVLYMKRFTATKQYTEYGTIYNFVHYKRKFLPSVAEIICDWLRCTDSGQKYSHKSNSLYIFCIKHNRGGL